jgi:hypothetical protein
MSPQEELAQHYPLNDWLEDFDYWVPRGAIGSLDVLPVVAYFHKKYAENPLCAKIAERFLSSLQFLEVLLPDLFAAGLVKKEADGSPSFPTPFRYAFYRAIFSWPESGWRQNIDVALLAKATGQQMGWGPGRH